MRILTGADIIEGANVFSYFTKEEKEGRNWKKEKKKMM